MSTEGSSDALGRRYGTRPAADRRPPSGLSGFVLDSDSAASNHTANKSNDTADKDSASKQQSAPSASADDSDSTVAQVHRPKPRPFDRSLHAHSDSDSDAMPSSTQVRRTASNSASSNNQPSSTSVPRKSISQSSSSSISIAARKPTTVSTTSRQTSASSSGPVNGTQQQTQTPVSKKTSTAKAAPSKAQKTPKITAAFAAAAMSTQTSKALSAMRPPPSRVAPRPSAAEASSSKPRPGSDVEHAIDFTDADEGQGSSVPKRKETAPEVALAAAIKVWERAHQDERDRIQAEEEGCEWIPAPGRRASTAYLNYKKPVIHHAKDNSVYISFPCLCCNPSTDVIRPCSEASTSNLLTHTNRAEKKRQQTIPEMVAKQNAASASDAAPLLTPSVTRQLAVAWVAESCRPLSIVEDRGFHAFLSEAQRKMLPSRFTVSRDLDRVFQGMNEVLKSDLSSVEGCMHLAADVWTSQNGHAFLGLIICYQKSGQAVRRLLEMVPFPDAHNGVNLAEATSRTLKKYDVGDRIWNIISDNASENTKMMSLLSEMGDLPRFKQDEDTSCRVRCSAHVLNLISKAILKPFTMPRRKKSGATGSGDVEAAGKSAETDDEVVEGEDVDWTLDVDLTPAPPGDNSDEEEEPQKALEDEDDMEISLQLNPEVTRIREDDEDLESILTPAVAVKRTARQQKELDAANKETGLAITKLAWISSTLRYNPKKRQMFRQSCKTMGCDPKVPPTLLRDVATRWDSTYNMIGRGLALFDGIIAFGEHPSAPVPKDKRLKRSDRAALSKVHQLLKPLAAATLKFSFKVSPTIAEVIGLFEDLDDHFTAIQESKDEDYVWQQAASRGHIVNEKYYSLTEQADVYSLAILLHPNYRSAYMDVLKWPRDWQNKAEENLRTTFSTHYEVQLQATDAATSSQSVDFDKLDKVTQALMRKAKEKQQSVAPPDTVGDWLNGLTPMQLKNGKVKRIDPLRWWWEEKQRGHDHHGLTALALDVFSCPATSVDVERLFSRAGRVVTPLRHNLKADRIAQMVTVGKWFEERAVPDDLLSQVLEDEASTRKDKRKANNGDSGAASAKRSRTEGPSSTAAAQDDSDFEMIAD